MNDSNVGTLPKSVKDGIYDFLKYRDNVSYKKTFQVRFGTRFHKHFAGNVRSNEFDPKHLKKRNVSELVHML
ncbi:hypothetical protein [Leptospira santarosai]|uniref:hypothetical protein n=1 Tax=Leptospira santarosai TaxID=28183 RepID=UPI00095D90AB|nr:hypothetical protein [Leptospira santarosai]OLY63567.1 hypothetical protein BWD11_13880 [Leptospira santarosai serovar Grippotyphosa]ONF77062.1 hypothetical protein BWD12_17065 [Leptospira santarosai serovar Bananal]